MDKKDQKMSQLQEEFARLQNESKEIEVGKYLAKREDLPDLGTIQIYDYDKDIDETSEQSIEILESLVDLYLGDNPSIRKHPYVINKLKEDANIYAEALFLQRMARRNFLTQLKQVDNGDNSARMHEVINQSISQIRENTKFSQSQRTELEKFYKDMRKDFGLNEISTQDDVISGGDESTTSTTGLMDNRSLNDMIDKYLKNKE
jgi:hypothetical protein